MMEKYLEYVDRGVFEAKSKEERKQVLKLLHQLREMSQNEERRLERLVATELSEDTIAGSVEDSQKLNLELGAGNEPLAQERVGGVESGSPDKS